jgi:UDP-MurNAc hydroxylase
MKISLNKMKNKDIKLTFVNHASYLIEYDGVGLLVDPWLTGRVFDNGWSHISKTYFTKTLAKKVTHIWFSHEHPDHFSPRDLINFKKKYSINPIILFQETKDKRLRNFCLKFSYRFKEIAHWSNFKIKKNFNITVVRAGMIDSLHILNIAGKKIVNLNDCLINIDDLKVIKRRCKKIDLLFTQFSYASWIGNKKDKDLRKKAITEKQEDILLQIKFLKPKNIIPFASFIYFCHDENKFMNDEIADLEKTCNFIKSMNTRPVVMYPGTNWNLQKEPASSLANIKKYKIDFKKIKKAHYIKGIKINLSDLEKSGQNYFNKIKNNNNYLLMVVIHYLSKFLSLFYKKNFLGLDGVNLMIIDYKKIYNFNWRNGFQRTESKQIDISLSSEVLKFIFDNEFGITTLLINARGKYKSEESLYSLQRIFMLGVVNSNGIKLIDLITSKILRSLKLRTYGDRVVDEAKMNNY